jgi:hypothetical protein
MAVGLSLAVALLAVACSSGDGGDGDGSSTADDSTPAAEPVSAAFDPAAVGEATFTPPPEEGGAGSVVLSAGTPDLTSQGYVEEELFVSGTATSYTTAEPLSEDGLWAAQEDEQADFTSRVVVRRPADAADFNGTVIVEWFNVSGGLDADPDWVYTHTELIRSGYAWVGVTAQRQGIEGGDAGVGAVLQLKNADPERYGSLDHPGDDFSYDIYSQVGAAARTEPDVLLGGLEPDRVVAMGESQSAFRLTAYVNAVAPVANVFDAYLVHSRGESAAPLSEDREAPTPTYFRTDLDVPVLVFSAESDLSLLGYALARQEDTDLIRSWEVAGTAHADAYLLGIGNEDTGDGAADTALFEAMREPPASVYGGVISCDAPINSGPHTYVLRAAVAALDGWARTGEAPPEMPRLELDDSGEGFVTDEQGNARGGIRTPHVDVPVAELSGQGQSGESFCRIFGTTAPFDAATLAGLYPDHQAFADAWDASLAEAVEAGVILEADAERIRSAAQDSDVGS